MPYYERGTIKKSSSYTEDVVGVTGLDDAIGVLAAEVDHFGVVEVVQVVAGHHQEFAETCQRWKIGKELINSHLRWLPSTQELLPVSQIPKIMSIRFLSSESRVIAKDEYGQKFSGFNTFWEVNFGLWPSLRYGLQTCHYFPLAWP